LFYLCFLHGIPVSLQLLRFTGKIHTIVQFALLCNKETAMARGRFTFWLDYNKDQQLILAETIDELKRKRTFVQTIRDGIRLICDLRAGRLEVLFEMFPWVKVELLAQAQPQRTAGEADLQRQLARLEKLLTEPPHTPQSIPIRLQPTAANSGPRALNTPQFDLPRLDDDDGATLVVQRDTSTDSALNFLNSMLRLQQ
jgi:hypothetical protein